jgi:hypothetical protein
MDTAGLVSSVVLGEVGPGVGVRSSRAGEGTSVVRGRPLSEASSWCGCMVLPRGEWERMRRGLVLDERQRFGSWGSGV